MSLDVGELPPELCVRPIPFVTLTGLDTVYNAIHKAIWDSFNTNRRPDRVPINFKVVDGDYEYPKAKSQKSSYECYVPKGMLKTNWMKKHLHELPALVVIFYDLDWDDPAWNERQMECSSKVEVVRSALDGRNTRVAVVLIQKNTPLPPGEDVVAEKRATELCNACDLSPKLLFVLPHNDHLMGYTLRLENAFYEISQGYYHHVIRKVKSHRELNKTTHQLLFVRHQFKMGFFSELKPDIPTALKHYKQAYANLMEVRAVDTNMLEIKTIAGFINYKICRLSFQLNTPLDAISHFRKHIDIFKGKIGSKDVAFEHSAWLSKQFSVFGDLFDEAIKLGLAAIQTQHPGFYYQQAAYHSISRKLLCHELCKNVQLPVDDPLSNASNMEYFGQRPWRAGIQSIEPPDPNREREGIAAIQYKELKEVNHSMVIIPLLSSAVTQFKKYKCPRMKRFLVVQMGEEYFHAKDYTKALTLFSHVLWGYRLEKWWQLLTDILKMALQCAFLIANIQEYITLCLEILSPWILITSEERERIQKNMMLVLKGKVPEPEPGCPEDCVIEAQKIWKNLSEIPTEPVMFTIEMNNIIPFVDCRAWFTETSFRGDRLLSAEICIRTTVLYPIRFSKLCIFFNNQHYNNSCILLDKQEGATQEEGKTGDLEVFMNKAKYFNFNFAVQPEDIGKSIEITGLVLQLGNQNLRCAVLHWSVGSSSVVQQPQWNPWRKPQNWQALSSGFDILPTHISTRILPRDSCIRIWIHHEPPALLHEFHAVCLKFCNNETTIISNVIAIVSVREDQDSKADTSLSLKVPKFDDKIVSQLEDIQLGELKPGMEVDRNIYLKSLQTGNKTVQVKVSYNLDVAVGDHKFHYVCVKEEEFLIPVEEAFKLSLKHQTMKFEKLDKIIAKEPFLLSPEIQCVSPWPLIILTSKIDLSYNMKTVDQDIESQLQNIQLNCNDRAAECICLLAPELSATPVSLGTYTITWKRKGSSSNIPAVDTTLPLPQLIISDVPLFIEVDLPAHGWVRTPLTASYTLHNRTSVVQDFELTLESSDAFMFSGQKQLHFRIMPRNHHKLMYNLYPLIAGYVSLPRLRLSLSPSSSVQTGIDDLVERLVPSHIFIMPQGKLPTTVSISA